MKNKLLWGVFFVFALGAGVLAGYHYKPKGRVAIRVGQPVTELDYDLKAAIDFLSYQLEKAGLKISGVAYEGGLYPEELNHADVNVFVRGYRPFFDLRMNNQAKDVFYVHRMPMFYREEMRHFDYYLTSQKSIFREVEDGLPIEFLAGGMVPHKCLKPNYQWDILYIYEDVDAAFFNFLTSRYKTQGYSGIEFMQLSRDEREKALAAAKVVVYDSLSLNSNILDCDNQYFPYAVYDIISYGRPVLTRYRYGMEEFFGGIMYTDDFALQQEMVNSLFRMSDVEREEYAHGFRERILKLQEKKMVKLSEWIKKTLKKM